MALSLRPSIGTSVRMSVRTSVCMSVRTALSLLLDDEILSNQKLKPLCTTTSEKIVCDFSVQLHKLPEYISC